MNSLHTLLAATDLSAPSRHAAQRAAMLARQIGARLELVHVLEQSALTELRHLLGKEGDAMQERVRAQAREALSQMAAEIGAPLELSIGQHLLEGAVLERIGTQLELMDAALLIMAARGAGFMRNWLLGATAERLLRMTPRPMLVVKQLPREAYRTVIVPVDYSDWSLGAIRLARAVAPHAKLILLHAYEVPFEGKMRFAGVEEAVLRRHRDAARKEALARLKKIATDTGLTDGNWRPVALYGDAASLILEQEEEQGADLIVLGKHGAGMIEELLLGSVTKHVLARARCDVLVAYH